MNRNNKIAGVVITFFLLLIFSVPAKAQWNWGGELYWGMNDTARVWSFNTNVKLFLANGVSFGIEGDVETKGFSLTKEGSGHLILFKHNPLWDGDILFASDTVPGTIELTGTLGAWVNDTIGHLYTGAIRSSDNQYSHFIINQHDTVVQSLSSTSDSAYLHVELIGKSVLRTGDFPDISGFFSATGGGTIYTNGIDSGRVHLLNGSRLITGRDAPHNAKDYSVIVNTQDSTIYVNESSYLQIGDYEGPSLMGAAGNVYQNGTLEIDVYDPTTNWNLTAYPNGDATWTTAHADRINVFAGGDYNFGTTAKMDVTFDPAFVTAIANEKEFYIPVISLADTTVQDINGAGNILLPQNLTGWIISFVIGDGTNGTNTGWGYIRGRREFFAVTDEVTTQKNTPVYIDVIANDIIYDRDETNIQIITPPLHGTASFVDKNIYYVPATGFVGRDSLVYEIYNDTLVSRAKVYINVIATPDNVSDADCFVDRPSGIWSIKNMFTSNTVAGGDVFEMSVPLVGDIDKDGIVEIVVAGKSMATGNFNCDSIKVFDGQNNTVKNRFPVEAFHGGFGTIAMADVDKDGFAEIFVATNFAASSGNQGYVICYNYDGTFKWKSSAVYTANATTHSYPYLKIIDFNGDEIPEICANDRIFNAVSGNLLLDCGLITGGLDYGVGAGHNSYYPSGTNFGNFSSTADMDNDGLPELVAGRNIYKISINSVTDIAQNSCIILRTVIPNTHTELGDGYTSVTDLNLDGTPDVIVLRQNPAARGTKYLYAWNGKTGAMLHSNLISIGDGNGSYGGSIPFAGDLDGDGVPEISFTVTNGLHAYKYNKSTGTLDPMSWSPLTTSDISGSTTLSLFDFDQDNKTEFVYRDMNSLRIIDGTTGVNKAQIPCFSWTMNEYPVVADVTGSGHANLVVLGKSAAASHGNGFLYVFEHDLSVAGAIPWAPARKVWNQWAYNAVNVNEDLTIPQNQMNPATVFAGEDGALGTEDDVHPFNAFLQQQTMLNKDGEPLFITPDAVPLDNLSTSTAFDDSVSITVGIINNGDAPMGSPVYVTLYADTTLAANKITTDSLVGYIQPGDTGYVTVNIPDIIPYLTATYIVARINDNGMQFPYQAECNSTNVIKFLNPALIRKNATLNGVQDNGTYPNPVSVLYGENIKYDINAVNVNKNDNTSMIITDTLPPYINYVTGTATNNPVPTTTTGTPQQTVLTWTLNGLASMATETVSYEATPESGASASQPLYINRAWVRVSDTIFMHSNSTYHQGAGVSIVTFSASAGGWIFNAEEQALDYQTTPRSGITIVPEEGYEFTGWSHDAYTSLRGETIPADDSLYNYEDITIYGNVELRANFAPVTEIPVEKDDDPARTTDNADKVWSSEDDLYIRATKGTIARVYTTDGILQHLITITKDGTTTTQLERGIYVVTLNGGTGWKVIVE